MKEMIECDIAVITGSGFYDFTDLKDAHEVVIETPFGKVEAVRGIWSQKSVLFISRHKKGHTHLSNMVNHRANIHACGQASVKAIIASSIVGITRPDLPLAKILLFNDLFYPDNRLPCGSACTLYSTEGEPGRGHYLFGSPFFDVAEALEGMEIIPDLTYAYVCGPRFNSKKEIQFISTYADALSQTAGPEAILAGELEIPYILLGYGVDYANGVQATPTPIPELTENMNRSKGAFTEVIERLLNYEKYQCTGFVYRFD